MKNNQNGVTLIELMLSVFLFTIVVSCSLMVLNKGLGMINDISNFLEATCLANQQMESLKSLKFDELKNHSFVISKFRVQTIIKDYEEGLKEVIVTIRWCGSIGIPKKISLVTLIAQRE